MNITAAGMRIPAIFNLLPQQINSPNKIYELVLPLFKAGSGLFFLGYGSKEICFDARKLSQRDYALAHGSLFICSAVCSLFEALHLFAVKNLGNFYPIVSWTGTGLFLFANFIALEENIRFFEEAKKQDNHIAMKSAVAGILSNLGYITTAAIAILGGSAALAFVIACVSACFGGLKILLDFYTCTQAI